jgi:competence ComEA-like helix-hairpin-helix protein
MFLVVLALITVVGTGVRRAAREWPRFFPGFENDAAGGRAGDMASRDSCVAQPDELLQRAGFEGAPTRLEAQIARVVQAIEEEEQSRVSPERANTGRRANSNDGGAPSAAQLAPGARLDPNRATAQELEALPGIGPVLAARIVADREAHGRFRRVEDLDRVSGIGPRMLERVRIHLAVGDSL